MSDRRFRLAPGTELVPVADGTYTLRSEFDAVELSGEAATEFAEKALAGLDESRTLAQIGDRLPGYAPESILRQLEALVGHGLLIEIEDAADDRPAPFAAFLTSVGRDAAATADGLAGATVAIFGLEAHGAHLARILAGLGVGTLRLIDPFPFEAGHAALTPIADPSAIGLSRQAAVARLVEPHGTRIERFEGADLDAENVRALVDGSDLAVGCWDQSYGGATHWLNRAALASGVPALFGELRATSTLAGPLYLPGRSACWMCYRMRSIACAPDFEQAIAFEEHLDRARRPDLAGRPVLPALPEQLGAALATEALRLLVGLHPPVLADTVVEFDGLSNASATHPVLIVPDCPVCGKKKPRRQPPLDELIDEAREPGDLVDLADLAGRIVDGRTGVVAEFGAVPRDPSEVPVPYVWRARVANHRFLEGHDEERATCSGKGMTRRAAWASCLGEAVERYSGGCWRPDELTAARRADLDGRSLDPHDLVLYADDQYPTLPYTPYRDDAELAWLPGRSLVHGDEVWLPAIAALMDYPIHSPAEHLCPITSNGLAAGPTPHDAVLAALSEVVERDAFLIAWLNRLPGRPHDAASHPDAGVRRLAGLYARRGVTLHLIELPTDQPISVFVGIAQQADAIDGPAATVGLGAAIDPAEAARKAALEVGQVRPSIRRRARTTGRERVAELAADPSKVGSMEDHALLYTDPSTAPAFDFLFGEPAVWPERRATASSTALRTVIDHFRAAGQDVLYIDLTPPDMAALGIFTARAILPGYQPIWFGEGERRLGGRRLFEFPFAAGLRPAPTARADLNPMPHPIA